MLFLKRKQTKKQKIIIGFPEFHSEVKVHISEKAYKSGI